MKISRISIEKLYGKFSIEWNMRDDINIIVSDNASYKTTLLKIMAFICEPISIPDEFGVGSVSLSLNDHTEIKFRKFKDNPLCLSGKAESDSLCAGYSSIIKTDLSCSEDKGLPDYFFGSRIIIIQKDDETLSVTDYKKQLRLKMISTFDVPVGAGCGSVLDQQLEKLETEYAYYLADFRIHLNGEATIDDLGEINADNIAFIGIVDKAFGATGKSVDVGHGQLRFKIGEALVESNKRLSAGEKQFLIVMLTVLLQRKEESVLILDDPGIAMHLDWQRTLIANIKRLNPNCQLIMTTHTPGIIMDSWEQYVTSMSSIIANFATA